MDSCASTSRPSARRVALAAAALAWVLASTAPALASSAVYKWVDTDGITHLSSERPPQGVQFERMSIGSSGGTKASSPARSTSSTK